MMKDVNWFKEASMIDILKEPNQDWEKITEKYNEYVIVASNYLNGGWSSAHPPGYGNSWFYEIYKNQNIVFSSLQYDNKDFESSNLSIIAAKKYIETFLTSKTKHATNNR